MHQIPLRECDGSQAYYIACNTQLSNDYHDMGGDAEMRCRNVGADIIRPKRRKSNKNTGGGYPPLQNTKNYICTHLSY